jgi:ABC-type polysaccharide/polyol phosphate export permease
VFLRDIGQVLGVVVNIWFFLTPIFYPRGVVPDRIQWLYGINPMLYAVEGYRAALLGQADLDLEGLGYLVVTALVVFVLGGLTFKKLKPAFADVL